MASYIDDLGLYATTLEEYLQRLQTMLERLDAYDIRLNGSKCQFGQKSMDFLGHRVSERGVEHTPERIEAIKNMTVPQTKTHFFFGKQFHYPLHGEKTRIGPEAAAGPVSNSREEHPNRCWPTLRFQSGPGSSAIRATSGHAEHDPRTAALPTPTPLHPLDSLPRPVPGCLPPPAPLIAPHSGPSPSPLQC